MNSQGKKQKQIDDSEGILAFALIGLITTLLAVIIQHFIL